MYVYLYRLYVYMYGQMEYTYIYMHFKYWFMQPPNATWPFVKKKYLGSSEQLLTVFVAD